MNKISVVIITFNEEKNIEKCLQSVAKIADEILVVDSFSTDQTKQIAESNQATVIEHVFDGHIEQKNWAKNQANCEWVLSLDADEVLDVRLQESILNWKKKPTETDGYVFKRLNFYKSKPIYTCGWYPDKKLRLFKKEKGDWGGKNPHDKFILQREKVTNFLDGEILHFTHPTFESLKKQAEKFGKIGALHQKDKSKITLVCKMIFNPAFKFLKNYFLKLGFLDGKSGLEICYFQAKETWLKYFLAL